MKILNGKVRTANFSIVIDEGLTFDVEAVFERRGMIESITITKDGKPVDIGDGNVARVEDFLNQHWMDVDIMF